MKIMRDRYSNILGQNYKIMDFNTFKQSQISVHEHLNIVEVCSLEKFVQFVQIAFVDWISGQIYPP